MGLAALAIPTIDKGPTKHTVGCVCVASALWPQGPSKQDVTHHHIIRPEVTTPTPTLTTTDVDYTQPLDNPDHYTKSIIARD